MPAPLANTALFKPITVGSVTLKSRLVQPPASRVRATRENVPTDSMLSYYSQRAENNGGLIIAETTAPAPEFGSFPCSPRIYTPQQVAAWKKIVEAVHKNGSFMSVQLAGVGNRAIPALVKAEGTSFAGASDIYFDERTKKAAEELGVPLRALTVEEIAGMVKENAAAAKRAVNEAGFDFVEIHGASLFLLEQFVKRAYNNRTDKYGGSIENRARFLLETVDAVVEAVGAEHTGIRLGPYSFYPEKEIDKEINPVVTYGYILSELERRAKEGKRLAYVSIMEPVAFATPEVQNASSIDTSWIDEIWKGIIIRTGDFVLDPEYAKLKKYVADDRTLIGVGRFYTSNPDLADRLRKGQELTPYDRSHFYTAGTNEGYIDWGKFGEEKKDDKGVPKALA